MVNQDAEDPVRYACTMRYPLERAQQEGRNLCRVSARRTHQEEVERQQVTIPCAAEDRSHLDLLC